MRNFLKILAVTILLLGASTSVCSAASASQGATVSPAVQNLRLTANQVTATYVSSVKNTTDQPLRVHVSSRDFTSLGNNGKLSLIDSGKASSHGIASYISVDAADFIVAPQQTHEVQVTLSKVDTLAAGGHYGVLLFDMFPPQPGTDASKNVVIKQTVASLLFVSTEGKGTYGLHVIKPRMLIAWFRLPKSYDLIFRNTGNVQITPRGYVNLTGPAGRQLAKGTINQDSGIVLPDTNRLVTTPLSAVSSSPIPGFYTIQTYYRYDETNQFVMQSQRFFYINYLLAIAVGVICLAAATYITWRKNKQRKKPLLRRSKV